MPEARFRMQDSGYRIRDTGYRVQDARHCALSCILYLVSCIAVACAEEKAVADNDAFVRVSPRDARYFELSNGKAYVPIGFNLVPGPTAAEMDGVVQKMAENRINYCRIWLGHMYWDVEHAKCGEYDAERCKLAERFIALARKNGIRVKVCLEFFRDIPAKKNMWSDKILYHKENGGAYESMKDFLDSEKGRAQFKAKLLWYKERFGDEPAVFAWELWNEMNAVNAPWQSWTEGMLPELHALFPKNLAVQSLGSFDHVGVRGPYKALCVMKGNDVAQVHRYLDLGASLEVCHGPVDVLANDAVRELIAYNAGKPIILTETGAVKPRHSGVSELYAKDKDGTLLHDMLFAPFFCGAAGTGHVWWWREAVERPNLWHHYARFAEAIAGIDVPGEKFVPVTPPDADMRIYALKGARTTIAWCRDAKSDWRSELQDSKPAQAIQGCSISTEDLVDAGANVSVRVYDPWKNAWTPASIEAGKIALPGFTRSIVVRVERK